MACVESPKDAEGRDIPRNTEVMYDANGKKVHITSFTYKCDVLGLWSQWKVFSPEITGEKDGMLPADSLYLTPPDSWEKLLEDLDRGAKRVNYGACEYFGKRGAGACSSCIANKNESCFSIIADCSIPTGRVVRAMPNYEPASGYNLPPCCFEHDIDAYFGDGKPTCAECRHMVECCCDYGVCGLEFDRAFAEDSEADEEPAFVAAWALSWLPTHMRDMQEEACEHFAK